MTLYMNPDTVNDLRAIADASLDDLTDKDDCGCRNEGGVLVDACLAHTMLGLLIPTVTAFEPVM